MNRHANANIQLSTDDILMWQPPRPSIDIESLAEIERFLFGDRYSLGDQAVAFAEDIESFILDQESFGSDHSALASKLALLAATSHASVDGAGDESISVDAETQARLEALLEAAGIGKLSTTDGKALADPEVLRRLSSSVSCALDEAASALSKMKPDSENPNEASSERSLVEACSEGDVSTVRKLLYEGRSANETTEDGESLLSLACSAGYYELAEVLLSMHANVEDCGAKGECTPLMEAASGGYGEIVNLLIQHGADVNATSNTGNTALTYACCGGYEDVVRILVDEGAELECHNENGHTPLMEAASGGHVGVASLLLDHGAGINTHSNEFKESALTLACYKGHLQMVRFLLQAGADQEHKTDEMHTALMEASMDGHVEVARLLLDSGAQVNMPADSFESPLTLAACGGHVHLADLLIQRGAALEEVNDEGYTPLMEAAREGHEEMVALLLAKGANVNAKTEETQETALTLACCGGFLECGELLVRAGADIETGCSTPLMEAAQEGQLDLVKFLIQQGANVNATTTSGDSALSYACEHGHTDVADHLLAAGADLEHETEGGRTPLMKAARAGHLCTVQFLISRGADVNRITKNNEHSVLSLACVCGHLSVVELLLCQGADPTHKLKDGSTMLLEAAKGGHTTVVQLLLDFPHNFMSLPPENAHVTSPTPERVTPRVPTKSLPMVVPPQEPDQAPELPITAACEHYAKGVENTTADHDVTINETSEKTAGQLQALYEQQLQYYQQQNPSDSTNTSSFNTAALVTHLIQQGSLLSQASDYLSPDAKLAVDKDVAITVESFLRSMASDAAAGKTRSAESIVEEAQGKLTELEQRIKEAIEKNAQLRSIEMMQNDQLTKDKVEEMYKTREEQIHKKQKILDELQKVERELQLKTQQQLKKHYIEMKQEEGAALQRGKPDGDDMESLKNQPWENETPTIEPNKLKLTPRPTAEVFNEKPKPIPPSTQNLNNGSSGSLPQAAKDNEDPFCQCPHHPEHCGTCEEPAVEGQAQLPPVPAFVPSQTLMPYHLEIDGHTESNHDTPLTLACAGGHYELVQLLIARGANIEHRDKKGFTPLILAATAGHVEVASILLSSQADIEAQSERTKDTPLSLACSGGRLEVVELLLDRGANKEHRNVSDYTPLSLAASGGYVNIIKLLLNHGAEINSRTGSKLGISPLMLAAMNGHTQAVQLLLDMGADINAQIETNRNTALTLACFQGRHEVVSLLVDRKANVEHRAKTGLTPLMEAASGGYAEVGRVLLDKGADPNAAPVPSSRDTALTIAADKGHYRFCELVLTRGAQVEVKNKKGNTPLWLACNGGHLDVVMLLVGKGADVNAADNRNVIPLMAAFRKGHVQVVRWLAKEVSQFPSDAECMRYIATISDRELLKRCHQCMECIVQAKDRQAQEANKFASELLEELDMEKSQEENRKERAARKREKRRLKRKQRKKVDEDTKDEKESIGIESEKDEQQSPMQDMANAIEKLQLNSESVKKPAVITSSPSNNSTASAVVSAQSKNNNIVLGEQADVKVSVSVPSLLPSNLKVSTPAVSVTGISTQTSALRPKDEEKTPESKRKALQPPIAQSIDSSGIGSGGETSPRPNPLRKHRKSATTHKQTSTTRESYAQSAKSAPRTTSATFRNSTIAPSPGKRTQRRDEGWKEVTTRKYGSSNAAKRIMVSSNLISRVIGRAGVNINAIREVTGAHIDIDKQRKGGQERTVTIKGASEAIKHAHQLITSLIKEDRTDHEISDIIAKAHAQAAQNAAAKQPVHKPTMTVVAAPIPSKPAWTVPPSIVAQAASQPRQPASTTSSFKVGVWAPPTTQAVSSNSSPTPAQNKWTQASTTVTNTQSAPTVEKVKKALFAALPPPVTSVNSIPSVSFQSKTLDKQGSKPVQPVAPMMSTKVTTVAPTRVPHSSFGPVGSALSTPHHLLPARSLNQGHVTHDKSVFSPSHGSAAPSACHNSMTSAESLMPSSRALMTSVPQSNVIPSGHMPISSSQITPISPTQSSAPDQNLMIPTQIPALTPNNAPVESMKAVKFVGAKSVQKNTETNNSSGVKNGFGLVQAEGNPMSSTYSPFSGSFTPSAGSATMWNSEPTAVGPYQKSTQSAMVGATSVEPEQSKTPIDQSKAPGYRGNMNSPAIENGIIGVSSSSTNNLDTASPAGSQQGSPGTDGEIANRPRPIGTERAYHRRAANPPLPLTTVVGNQATNIWSYDKLTPARIGMQPLEQAKYTNWSNVGSNDGIMTTATSNKPQVTASEIPSSHKTPTIEPLSNPHMPTPNHSFSHHLPPVGFNAQTRMHPSNNHFSQTSSGGVGSQPPIGSHLGSNSSVGIVGPQQQQQSALQPIGSHLGGAGHFRSNNTFQHGQQMQRNYPSNPVPQQSQRYQVPYYMQADISRYVQNMGSDVNWQQHSMYNHQSRHTAVGPYQHKEMQNSNGMYGSIPSQYSGNIHGNDGSSGIATGYSNTQMQEVNPSYQMHADGQTGYMRDGAPFLDGRSDYMVRGVAPNNFSNPTPAGNAWDQSTCRPHSGTGYHAMNGGTSRTDVPSAIGTQQSMEADAQQGWEWLSH
ncbi:ankyrin repeat domain-containing protein 17-like isoform X2 [Clavelina lepadiformis]|uniref:ankyrin repeat domain-containing protein 17-like isoform X2 n=1 Tax=Clavelina lepadiformis TaxID=159417 RepID=UPI0040437077